MHDPNRPLRVGSLFSGYGGLDLAVEHVFDAETIWFSEISQPARVFAHHWPEAPNLGDITTSTGETSRRSMCCAAASPARTCPPAGKRAGLAPGTLLRPLVAHG